MSEIIVFVDHIGQLTLATKQEKTTTHLNVVYPCVVSIGKDQQGRLTASLVPILPEQLTVSKPPVWSYPVDKIVESNGALLAANLVQTYTAMYNNANNQAQVVSPVQQPASIF